MRLEPVFPVVYAGAGTSGENGRGGHLVDGAGDDGKDFLAGCPADNRGLSGGGEPAEALVSVGAGSGDTCRVGERLGHIALPGSRGG